MGNGLELDPDGGGGNGLEFSDPGGLLDGSGGGGVYPGGLLGGPGGRLGRGLEPPLDELELFGVGGLKPSGRMAGPLAPAENKKYIY